MCCCCPSAISALFCLWFQSGCNQGAVAGALTFFPPDPPFYKFERYNKDGKVLGDDEEATVADTNNSNTNNDENNKTSKKKKKTKDQDSDKHTNTNSEDGQGDDDDDDNNSLGDIEEPTSTRNGGRSVGPLEAPPVDETRQKTETKMKSPIQQLTEQATERRKRAKGRCIRDVQDANAGVTFQLLLDPRLHVPPHDESSIEAVKIPCPRGVYVAAVIYRVPDSRCTDITKTMIISHGNATDIGAMFPMQVILAHSLDCHVVIYDYSGYGESGGVSDEASTYRDITSVYDYVLDQVANGIHSNIVLYGQSVGSGPCCYLAAKKDYQSMGGMILHGPITSGMRVLTSSRALACLDIYPNIDRIKHVKCPVMVIHGQLDQEVDFSHGIDLHQAVPEHLRREPWWVPDRGHNDITEGPGKLSEYIRRLRTFLQSLD